jgi:hypothetical protein
MLMVNAIAFIFIVVKELYERPILYPIEDKEMVLPIFADCQSVKDRSIVLSLNKNPYGFYMTKSLHYAIFKVHARGSELPWAFRF